MIKLIKKDYLGEGYVHFFENVTTGELLVTPCSQENYEAMGRPGGAAYNPTAPDGYKWIGSAGGTLKVDTPSSMLEEGQYCEVGDIVHVNVKDLGDKFDTLTYPKGAVDETGTVVEASLIELAVNEQPISEI